MAMNAGEKYYASGRKCKYNHPDCRYTMNGVCVECHRVRSKNNAQRIKENMMARGYGLDIISIKVHPEDKETLELFSKALLFDRGIY